MEVLQEGLGVKVSEGYVYDILSQARAQAKVTLVQMWEAMPLKECHCHRRGVFAGMGQAYLWSRCR